MLIETTVDQEEDDEPKVSVPAISVAEEIAEPALPVAEDISEAKMRAKPRSSAISKFFSLLSVLVVAFLSISVTDSPILATPLGEAISYFSKLINDLGRIDDAHPLKFMNLTDLEESSSIYHGYLKGSEELDKKLEPIEFEEDEESETEPDEEEFQMESDLDDGDEVELEEAHELRLKKLPSQLNQRSLERDLDQGLTTSNVELELAESKSFIGDNAIITNAAPESSPIDRHDEDNVVGAYQILGISSLTLSLLAATLFYVKRRGDKTMNPVVVHADQVSSKKFVTDHVVKEKHSSQNWPTEVDVAGGESCPSEMSSFQISSSYCKNGPKSENDEARARRRKLERVIGETPWLHLKVLNGFTFL
ncbi:hypothetical protein HAX54_012897 [Datura stramonium]|uniref:Uncharacterized protein n=1 Tax=Datura stramonium TaxID=4076 RepID=A0ABS8RXT2_DATST|nr:hypothetical protein [Datura stramonium]